MVKKLYNILNIKNSCGVRQSRANPPVLDVAATQTTGAIFQITSSKHYLPVATLFLNDNIKFLEDIEQGFKRTIFWNKYRSEITTQPKNNDLDYLIDPTFRNNRLFVLSFKNGNNDLKRISIDKYYTPLVEIKDFNALIEKKLFFGQAVKSKQESFEKLIEMPKKYDYTTINLLDFFHFIKIVINLLARIYQDKQIQVFLKKLILQEN